MKVKGQCLKRNCWYFKTPVLSCVENYFYKIQGVLGAQHLRAFLLMKYGKLPYRGGGSKFPANAGPICDMASMSVGMLMNMIKNTPYLMQSTEKGYQSDRLKFWPAPVIANFICSSTWRHVGSPCNTWQQNRCGARSKALGPWGWCPVNCIWILWTQWHVPRFGFFGTCTHSGGHLGNHNREVFLSLLVSLELFHTVMPFFLNLCSSNVHVNFPYAEK